jgi:hypothetical protein
MENRSRALVRCNDTKAHDFIGCGLIVSDGLAAGDLAFTQTLE